LANSDKGHQNGIKTIIESLKQDLEDETAMINDKFQKLMNDENSKFQGVKENSEPEVYEMVEKLTKDVFDIL